MSEATPKQTPDWKTIEADYRAGVKTLRQIAGEHGISHVAIANKAKRLEWTRDLSHKIKAAADAIVTKAAVTSPVTKTDELVIVKANAEAQAGIRLSHQSKIRRALGVFEAMLGELEMTSNPEGQGLVEALMDLCRKPEDSETEEDMKRRKKRQADQLEKILALPSRVDTGKKLAEMLERLVNMERVAHGIKGEEETPGGELAEFVKQLAHKGSALPVSATVTEEE